MSYLWDSASFERALNAKLIGPAPEGVKEIAIDSRVDVRGAAFFCIKGPRLDGHDFAYRAYQKGAAILVIDKRHAAMFEVYADREKICYIVVEDVLTALYALAHAARQRSKARIVAITGSVGKTTTKEMLRFVLSHTQKLHANPASFNNHWGVPLTLARMPQDTEIGIFEVGMSHKGEIAALSALIKPHIALITKIALSHLENFKDLKDIASAKAEIFESMAERGTILLNRDDEYYGFLKEQASQKAVAFIKSFGKDEKADYRLLTSHAEAVGENLEVSLHGHIFNVYNNLAGAHNSVNCLAAISVIDNLGVDLASIINYFSQFQPVAGRGLQHKLLIKRDDDPLEAGHPLVLIDESYNANPQSMEAALKILEKFGQEGRGRVIAVLGDMLELGEDSKIYHQNLSLQLNAMKIDQMFLIGNNMAFLKEKIENKIPTIWKEKAMDILEDVKEFLEQKVQNDKRNIDIMMLKASHSIEIFKLVQYFLNKYQQLD